MKIRQTLALTTLFLAASAALAGQATDNNKPLTRAEVRQSVIEARNDGELLPAGDAAEYPRPQATTPSTLTRSEVRHEVLKARADDELIPAGEGDDEFFERSEPMSVSVLSRADVERATLKARNAGELLPAGQLDERAVARDRAQEAYAWAARQGHKTASAVATSN
jgi:hypothetical protein